MAFSETLFPVEIARGSALGAGFKTAIATGISGKEQRTGRWAQERNRYRVDKGITTTEKLATVKTFHRARQGALLGFRFLDFTDWNSSASGVAGKPGAGTTTPTDQGLGTGDGTTVNFQLRKVYVDGSDQYVRTIIKPVAGTTKVALDGVNQAANWAVNTTNGVVTFDTAPANGVSVTAGFEFHVPVRFGETSDDWLAARLQGNDVANLNGLELLELTPDEPQEVPAFMGGAEEINLATTTTLTVNNGRVITVLSTPGSIALRLPDPANLEPGGPYFFIRNVDLTNTFLLQDHLGGAIRTMAANGAFATIWMTIDASGNRSWQVG